MVEVAAVLSALFHGACVFAVRSTAVRPKMYICSFSPPSPVCVHCAVSFDVGLLAPSKDACAAGIADARTVTVFDGSFAVLAEPLPYPSESQWTCLCPLKLILTVLS